ncbi:MAG: histidine phosphatase family protein [Eubacterium sp.]|jgi:broad specificity phosphatase PhoE
MKIWLIRHGQTDYNNRHLMQGRSDIPLNATGIEQAEAARARIGDVHFDAVYASPLVRTQQTAEIVGAVKREDIIIDERIIEVDMGPYEKKNYYLLGPRMGLYWALPEVFPVPRGVETRAEMRERASSFLSELEKKNYSNVLVASHGGILRALNGYLCDRRDGFVWRPKMKNCEIRVYESEGGRHELTDRFIP